MDYGIPSFRKTKGDKKAKQRYGHYKKGGKYRTANIQVNGKREG